ncbi:hypothetical protein [Nonlabens ulvanivorans]|uniref:Uncharacterized protein n=1 Tax=Nonlabens ulvanivorans TaxID=906888 RepID=A0A084JYH7_NONUL|nr:hypothetical protein [Nonlabens ulvanivorans]KEZ94011.1 hypothetical protein IL45_02370 [Nonlabens ulvanivorans]PRX11039.1 hypothetical protein LY02_02879 [Nonlabens ulvanivorans]
MANNYPIWLVHDDLSFVEKIELPHQLYNVTLLSVKKKSMIGSFIVKNNYEISKIEELIDLGNKNSIWMFEFFNPLRKVQYKTTSVNSDNPIYNKIINLVKKNPEGSDLL